MNYLEFVAAGQHGRTFPVFLTLLATIFGASATLGVAEKAETIGFPAAWWLFSGAVGLAAQGVLLSARIRSSGARTLPELARLSVGPGAQRLVAAVIVLAWPAVVAAQLLAFADLWIALAGGGKTLPVAVCAATVVGYTFVGGQRAVVRTDGPQLFVLAAGFAGLFLWIFSGRCGGTPVPADAVRLVSADFGPRAVVLSLLSVGGAYFLGPDIASRALLARDGKTARRAALAAAPALAAFGALVALSGMWAAANVPGPGNPVLRIALRLPAGLKIGLAAGLFCAVLSSLDTCLVNAAAIAAGDLAGVRSVRATRWAVLAVGAAATALALAGSDIIGMMLSAYSVYTPGVVPPLAVAIIAGRAQPRLWLAAVAAGGACGLAGAFVPRWETLGAFGMAVSSALALLSVRAAGARKAA